jgi:hypothetical protein
MFNVPSVFYTVLAFLALGSIASGALSDLDGSRPTRPTEKLTASCLYDRFSFPFALLLPNPLLSRQTSIPRRLSSPSLPRYLSLRRPSLHRSSHLSPLSLLLPAILLRSSPACPQVPFIRFPCRPASFLRGVRLMVTLAETLARPRDSGRSRPAQSAWREAKAIRASAFLRFFFYSTHTYSLCILRILRQLLYSGR